jgi:hypothetical protein
MCDFIKWLLERNTSPPSRINTDKDDCTFKWGQKKRALEGTRKEE